MCVSEGLCALVSVCFVSEGLCVLVSACEYLLVLVLVFVCVSDGLCVLVVCVCY